MELCQVDTIIEYAENGLSIVEIADRLGLSKSAMYQRIRRYQLKRYFMQYLVGCRDICPAMVRIVALSGANLNTVRMVVCPDVTYPRLKRFVKRERMECYFEEDPHYIVQWVEKCPPLYSDVTLAEYVVRHKSASQMNGDGGPCWKTVVERFGVSSWEEAKDVAQRILTGER